MTRQIVWKEAREQGAVLLALVGMGTGLLAAAGILGGTLGGPEGLSIRTVNYTGRILLIMLVMTAGVVVGGSLFAGEREAGTFTFLDHLPASRWRVWWRKVLAGGVLTLVATLLLLLAAGLAGQLGGTTRPILVGWTLAVVVLAGAGYGWGVFGSTRAESSLSACGLGLLGSLAATVVCTVGAAVIFAIGGRWLAELLGYSQTEEANIILLLALWAMLFVPLPLAALSYTRPDRSRRLAEQEARPQLLLDDRERPAVVRKPRPPMLGRSRRMSWLVWRQLRMSLLVQTLLAAAAGMFLVPWNEDWPSSILWPPVGLFLGMLAGVASLSDEQRSGAMRFWAERRLPVGRLWRDKVLNGALLTLAVSLVALLPLFVAAIIRHRSAETVMDAMFLTGLFEPGFPRFTYLLLGPAYGFAFGHLAGMLFQKGTVAGAVGLMLGGTFAAAWVPSLLAGGFHGWMAFAPPAVALLTARWLAWPWATNRIGRRGPLLRLAAGTLAAAGCVVAGLAYRAVGEVDVVANAGEHLQFRANLPTFDENQPGRDLRRAFNKWQELPEVVRTETVSVPLAGRVGDAPWDGPNARRFVSYMREVLRDGWPNNRPDADAWMDRAFATGWDDTVFLAATKPPGVLEDPNEYQSLDQPLRYIEPFRELTPVFLARGLQRQAHGEPADFVRRMDAWLAAVRTAKRHTLPQATFIAQACELQVYLALDRWLERLAGRPDLVRQALDVVRRHDDLDRPDPTDVRRAEQVLMQNAVDAPGLWLPRRLEADSFPPGGLPIGQRAGGRAEFETNLVAFAWVVPWEKERLRRAVALGNVPERRHERTELLEGTPGLSRFAVYGELSAHRPPYSPRPVATRRAAVLSLALRLHLLADGRYPDTLVPLVPTYLPAIPADPYSGQPLLYRRLAKAETVVLPTSLVRAERPQLPPGADSTYPQYLAVAGLAGGLTGWPMQPGWLTEDNEADSQSSPWAVRPGLFTRPADLGLPLASEWYDLMRGTEERQTAVRLAAGRAVVWSVGENKVDDGGRFMEDGNGRTSDLVFPVPDPPADSVERR